MLRSIIFFLELFVFILAVFVFSLLYGFTLSNLSYENINISKLYIKYDKNLIVSSDSIEITNKSSNKTYNFELNASIDIYDDIYHIDIKKLLYKNSNLKLVSKLDISEKKLDEILDGKINNIKFSDFSFKFDKKLKDIKTKNTFITYKNNNIYFKLINPRLDNIKLDKSKVVLKDIFNNITLDLDLYTKHSLDKKLLDIIKYYGVNLDLKQYYGKNDIFVKVNIPLNNVKNNVDVYVKAKVNDSKIKFENQIYKSKNLNVEYQNKIITINSLDGIANINNNDIHYNKLDLIYKNNIIDINGTKGYINILDKNISYNNLILNINNNKNIKIITNLKYNQNNININSFINLKSKNSSGKIFIKNLKYKNLLELSNKNITYDLKFKDGIIDLEIPELNLKYNYDSYTKHTIEIDNFDVLLKYINFLEFTNVKKSSIIINTFDDFNNTDVYLKNVYVNIKAKEFNKFKFNNTNKSNSNIEIQVNNSVIGYDKRYLNIKDSNILIKNKNINASIGLENVNSNIIFTKKDDIMKIKANNLDANLINRLLKSNKLKDGDVSINLIYDNRIISGNVKLNKTTIRNLRAVNNLITFINTTPAYFNPLLSLPTLFRLGQNGFNFNGYYIKNGNFNFIYNVKNKILNINSLYTKGLMADFKGKVKSDFKNKKISANLDAIFLKDYSKVIKHIPILGYIIVGNDGNFVTKVDLEGDFEKQTFKTHVLNDATNGVFNVIKRTISLPLLPFIKEEDK